MSISRTYYILAIAMSALCHTRAQEPYRTEIFRNDVKSLEIKVEGEKFANPYIELNSDKNIEISFDALHRRSGRFAYNVIHCDADWKKSALIPIEYMKGFRNVAIEDFANSITTTTHYTNYLLTFPNEDVRLTASGNYVIQVFEEDTPNDIVFNACFSVVEPKVEISASVNGNTDIDFNKTHQQVSFSIIPNIDIPFPQRDLRVFVYKNNNRGDIRGDLQPSIIRNKEIRFEHNKDLIFDAGNEYRRIEILTHRYNGMGVETTKYYEPYYHATLYRDKKRNRSSYLYDQDQNGRFFINCSECEDPATEGDYYIVHFSLTSDEFKDGDVYIYGDLFNNILNESSRMEYNAESGAYEKAVMLKLGLYNYQYVFLRNGEEQPSFAETEGNFYETENEYTITVYYRPIGERYDHLIGIATISGRHAKL